MERRTTIEAGRKKLIRETASMREKQPRLPANTVMRQVVRYKAIDTAKKQFSKAQQTTTSYQEQSTYTAVEQVENHAANTAGEIARLSISAVERGRQKSRKNAFHRETYSASQSSPKEQMRQSFIKKIQEQKEQAAETSISTESLPTSPGVKEYPFYEAENLEGKAPSKIRISSAPKSNFIRPTGQRPTTLPRNASSGGVPKSQIIKERGRRLARDKAIQEIKADAAQTAVKASDNFFKKLGAAVTKTVTPSKETLLYAAGVLVLIIIPFVIIMGVASMLTGSGDGRNTCVPVSAEVEAYRPLIRLYASQYGIPEYEDLIAAVMMQESGGRGTDPMQCSESGYNTRYPHSPNSITDPEYSIDVGIQALANALQMAGVESPIDLEQISLALQGYNFGNGYISWALANYGGYSELNAIEFSNMMASRYGWAGYGDKAYVSHVLRYYPIGRSFMSEGNSAMVAVAQSQLGNVGGMTYWSWYGYSYRVEWCGCFVSWCAEQCGLLDSAVVKFAYCPTAVRWFQDNGAWLSGDYTPLPGDIIFFDWLSDGRRDGLADHVGIVERVENNIIYTIEGNVNDRCVQGQYHFGTAEILGYGITQ